MQQDEISINTILASVKIILSVWEEWREVFNSTLRNKESVLRENGIWFEY